MSTLHRCIIYKADACYVRNVICLTIDLSGDDGEYRGLLGRARADSGSLEAVRECLLLAAARAESGEAGRVPAPSANHWKLKLRRKRPLLGAPNRAGVGSTSLEALGQPGRKAPSLLHPLTERLTSQPNHLSRPPLAFCSRAHPGCCDRTELDDLVGCLSGPLIAPRPEWPNPCGCPSEASPLLQHTGPSRTAPATSGCHRPSWERQPGFICNPALNHAEVAMAIAA